ncbi:MAG: hypothetical protein WCO98_07105 [bacterium]
MIIISGCDLLVMDALAYRDPKIRSVNYIIKQQSLTMRIDDAAADFRVNVEGKYRIMNTGEEGIIVFRNPVYYHDMPTFNIDYFDVTATGKNPDASLTGVKLIFTIYCRNRYQDYNNSTSLPITTIREAKEVWEYYNGTMTMVSHSDSF